VAVTPCDRDVAIRFPALDRALDAGRFKPDRYPSAESRSASRLRAFSILFRLKRLDELLVR